MALHHWSSTLKLVRYSLHEASKWTRFLQQHGVVIIADTPIDTPIDTVSNTKSDTNSNTKTDNREFYDKLAAALNTSVYSSMYGDIWDTAGDFGTPTTDDAYSNIYLPPHTDLNYVPDTAKYQIFTSLIEAHTGGETVLVDGGNVANKFKKLHQDSHKLLSNTSFLFTCSENIHSCRHKIFDGDVIHHNHGDMEESDLEDYHLWNDMTLDPYFSAEVKLSPGETIVVDNHRCFHGRNAFRGRRNLKGCYFQ